MASEIYPPIFGLTLLGRIVMTQGKYLGRHAQINDIELNRLTDILLGANGTLLPSSNMSYKGLLQAGSKLV